MELRKRLSMWNILLLVSFIFFILNGIFYVFFAGASFDEGNFLYKSFLYTSGLIKPYTPNSTWSEYMPGGYILFGYSQLIFGKSFYVARFFSFLIGVLNLILCYHLAKKMAGKTAGVLTLVFMVTNAKLIQTFSTVAVYSFTTFFLLLFFLTVVSRLELRLKTFISLLFVFTGAFFRSSLLPNYILVFCYLLYLNRKRLSNIIIAIISFLTIPIFIVFPFLPGISHIFLQLPIIRTVALKFGYPEIFFYSFTNFNLHKVVFSLLEFIKFHQIWLILLFAFFMLFIIKDGKKEMKSEINKLLKNYVGAFILLISFFIFSLIVNYVGAYGHCPKCSIAYFYYYAFSGAIILGILFSVFLNIFKKNVINNFLFIVLLLYVFSVSLTIFYGNTTVPFNETGLQKTQKIAQDIKNNTKASDKIFTITEPHYLYLSGREGFGPLINKEYGLRLTSDSKTLSEVGYWNAEMTETWLEEANWVLIDNNNLLSLKAQGGEKVYNRIISKIQSKYVLFKTYENAWPTELRLYKKIVSLNFLGTN